MVRKLTYIKHQYDSELIKIEEFDEENQLLYLKEIAVDGISETKVEYHSFQNIKSETNFLDGEKISLYSYEYNSKDQLISQKMYMADELFEETDISYTSDSKISITKQNGKEISKYISNKQENKTRTLCYEDNEFIEKSILIETKNPRITKEIIYSPEDEILAYENNFFNEDGYLHLYEQLDSNKSILLKEEYEFKESLIVKIIKEGYASIDFKDTIFISYDSKGREIKSETRNENNVIKEFVHTAYDSKDREIEMVLYSVEEANSAYGNGGSNEEIHYFFEYEEI